MTPFPQRFPVSAISNTRAGCKYLRIPPKSFYANGKKGDGKYDWKIELFIMHEEEDT